MSRISTNSLCKITYAPLKTPNFKEITVSSSFQDRKDVTPQHPIIMDEYGQTPDHYYLAKKPPPAFFQVKRKLDLQSIPTKDIAPKEVPVKVYKTRQKKNNATNGNRGKKVVEKPRYDTSLGRLTTKFHKLLLKSQDGTINLNEACTVLTVPKRRLYDITNVLEGAGLVEKRSRNVVQWLKGNTFSSSTNRAGSLKHRLEREIHILESKENILDELIYFMKTEIDAFSQSNSQYHYVTNEDLKAIGNLSDRLILGLESTTPDDIIERSDTSCSISSPNPEMEALMLLGKLSFQNIVPQKSFFVDDYYSIRIQNDLVLHNENIIHIKNEPIDNEVPLGMIENENNDVVNNYDVVENENSSNKNSYHVTKVEKLNECDLSYSQLCRSMWSQGDTVIKNAFISEEDDIAPMGKHLFLQTEDQDLDLLPFSPTVDSYAFSLDDGEGLTDLFDCGFSCP